MEGISFEEEDEFAALKKRSGQRERGLIGFIIRNGWAKNTQGANAILIGVLCLTILTTFLVLRSVLAGPSPEIIEPPQGEVLMP